MDDDASMERRHGDPIGLRPLPWDERDLPALVTLDALGGDIFRDRFWKPGSRLPLFGGLVLAQSLGAAAATVAGRPVHSMHAYFLRGGSEAVPTVFTVERIRDGRFFSRRRVTALQKDIPIFHLECSFHAGETGVEHQTMAEPVPPPDDVADLFALADLGVPGVPPRIDLEPFRGKTIEVRPVGGTAAFQRAPDARRAIWMRVPSAAATEDDGVHRQVLAYLSDHWLASTALKPHAIALPGGNPQMQIASIDHAIWFHRPVRMDQWLLYALDSPVACRGTGLIRGMIYDRDGVLVASVAQEALLRPR